MFDLVYRKKRLVQFILALITLPFHHRDPFDRILLAQAHTEGITLVTVDVQVARYPGSVRKV